MYSMDTEYPVFPMPSSVAATNVYKNPGERIKDYFFAPDKVKIWFSKKGREGILGGVTKIEASDESELAESSLPLQCPQNRAHQYGQFLSQYGTCTYAIDNGNTLVAGFLNGSLLMVDRYVTGRYVIEHDEDASLYGQAVTACCLVEDNVGGFHNHTTSILVGFKNKSLWLLDRNNFGMTHIGTLPFCIDSLVKGHSPNIWIASGDSHIAIIQNKVHMEPEAMAWTACQVGASVQWLMPYSCGILYKTDQECALLLPYTLQDCEKIINDTFEQKQRQCVLRLIGQASLGLKPALIRGEKSCFETLPNVMQALLCPDSVTD